MKMYLNLCCMRGLASILLVMLLGGCGSSNAPGTPDIAGENIPDSSDTGDEAGSSIKPNVLLIISDDQGLDASAQYNVSTDLPNTPVVNALAQSGIVYENAWATPSCTTTRAATLTGLHGVNNGVTQTPGVLSPSVGTIQSYLAAQPGSANYATAVFGKWHVAGGNPDPDHPASLGIDYYAGNLTGNLADYFQWDITINGEQSTNSIYHTTAITDLAIDWIDQQTTPWFAWVAYSAPHSPFHAPPTEFNQRGLSGTEADIETNKGDYFLSAIETLDTELGRLLATMDEEERARTIIIYIGDNGSPRTVIDRDAFGSASHGKGSLFEGGVRVPFIISGYGVSRANARETGLVHVVDLFPTLAELLSEQSSVNRDGYSLVPSFSNNSAIDREYNYTEFVSDRPLGSGWTVRSADFKYFSYNDGSEALYSLAGDVSESLNLLTNDTANQDVLISLKNFGLSVRSESDDNEVAAEPIDITDALFTKTNANCTDYTDEYTAMATDAANGTSYTASVDVSANSTHCVFQSNAIPNHTFNDGPSSFPNPVSEQNTEYLVPVNPTFANNVTPLSLRYDDAILLNGVKIDLLAAGCFGVGNGRIGCNDDAQPWRYDPMYAANGFRVDQHNAHTQPNGAYHYHGNPNALFNAQQQIPSPVIGFAADGFPIFGSYFDDNGTLRKAQSSYKLKSGSRPTGDSNPQGQYDGSFRDDYEYIEGLADLDECNGMSIDGRYGYYVTDTYPHILACFRGSVDESFRK